MTGQYENFSRLDGSFELSTKKLRARGRKQQKKHGKSTTTFSITEGKTSIQIYFLSIGLVNTTSNVLLRAQAMRKITSSVFIVLALKSANIVAGGENLPW